MGYLALLHRRSSSIIEGVQKWLNKDLSKAFRQMIEGADKDCFKVESNSPSKTA